MELAQHPDKTHDTDVARFLESAIRHEPAPCDGCRHAPACARGACCEAFALYLCRGPGGWQLAPRVPSVALFKRLFVG